MITGLDSVQILIVDDDPNIVRLIRQILEDYEDAGVKILEALTGRSALAIINQHLPKLVFLDINLGDMSGGLVCDLLKDYLDIPIVVVTALDHNDPNVPFKADGCIVKPFSADQILAVAQHYIPLATSTA